MIERPHYLAWLDRWRDHDVVKVVTGMRRSGKSVMLKLYQRHLIERGIMEQNITSINFESLDEAYPRTAEGLYRYIVDRLGRGQNYVFLDEVQHVADFERTVDALAVRDDVDVYITGSNAHMLSGELATLLTGRYVELRMLPLSFVEYRSAGWDGRTPDDLFNRYLTYGGLPYTTRLDSDESVDEYLSGVFNTIVAEDIARRHPRMDMRALRATASFVADNVGNISSRRRISGELGAAGTTVSPAAVGDYLDALMENYLLFKAERYDLKGREYLTTLEKYYLGDPGLRLMLLGKTQGDLGHRIENVVYLELLRRHRVVAVGRQGTHEVDFVADGQDGRHYYQVAASVLDPATLDRELRPLFAIHDGYPKTLLTLDRVGVGDYDGIEHRNLVDWLLDA